MEFEQALRNRYSARRFKPDPVARETILRILDLARLTPSWCNVQPWHVEITSGAATERLREQLLARVSSGVKGSPDFAFPAGYAGDYRERRKVCGVQLYQSLGIGRDDKAGTLAQFMENFRLFGAPHAALITTEEELGIYGAVDCGLYAGNFMLAAHTLGVDTVAQASLASHPDLIRDFFGLPPNRKVVCGISFGYAQAGHPINAYRTARASALETASFTEV